MASREEESMRAEAARITLRAAEDAASVRLTDDQWDLIIFGPYGRESGGPREVVVVKV